MVATANCIALHYLDLTVVLLMLTRTRTTGSLVAHIVELGLDSLSCQLAEQKLVLFLFCSLLTIIAKYDFPINK